CSRSLFFSRSDFPSIAPPSDAMASLIPLNRCFGSISPSTSPTDDGRPSRASRSSAALVRRDRADIRNQAPTTIAPNTTIGVISETPIAKSAVMGADSKEFVIRRGPPVGPGPTRFHSSPLANHGQPNSHLDIDNFLDRV